MAENEDEEIVPRWVQDLLTRLTDKVEKLESEKKENVEAPKPEPEPEPERKPERKRKRFFFKD